MPHVVAIIQARMGSTRLPGKVMADVAGRPLIDHVVKRAQQAQRLDLVTVATSDRLTDDIVAHFCAERDVPYFRGSEEDVLDRYYQAARCFSADVIVRLTADCPLLDPEVIDRVVQFFQRDAYDYVSNNIERTYPVGLDTEIFQRSALERAWGDACLRSEREHVTPYICKYPNLFHLANVKHYSNLSKFRWTVDLPQDLEFVRRVYGYLGPNPTFGMEEILRLLRSHPELQMINDGIDPDEGYAKSLREDERVFKRVRK